MISWCKQSQLLSDGCCVLLQLLYVGQLTLHQMTGSPLSPFILGMLQLT